MNSRTATFAKYPEHKLKKDERPMDEVCGVNDTVFALQSHQIFLQKWMEDHFDEFKSILLYHRIGSGKCFQKNTPILMFDGSIKMVQDVSIGDLVMGDDSTERTVLTLGRGEDDMYKIIPEFGDPYVVNSEHILVLQDTVKDEPVHIEVRDYVNLPIERRTELLAVRASVKFPERTTLQPPYLYGKTHSPHEIPDEYKLNSFDARMNLLGGICDSIGTYIASEIVLDINSDDVLYLARSLGFGTYTDGSNRIVIFGRRLLELPSLFHRQDILEGKDSLRDGMMHAFVVECKARDNYYGFTLDGNHKFLLGDFTVTHNTCTSITMALKYMQLHKNGKVTVILPARLKTNFYDELFSPCVTTNVNVPNLYNVASDKDKNALKKELKKNFDVMSIDAFRKSSTGTNIKEWAREFTKDKFIIVDEVHNLLSKCKVKDFIRIEQNNIVNKNTGIKGMNTIMFRLLLKNAHPTCKFVFLTATPIFDNTRQFRDLLQIMNPTVDLREDLTLRDAIEMLRGRVSFFPGASPNSYPSVSYKEYTEITGPVQRKAIMNMMKYFKANDDETKNSFRIKERLACISAFSDRRIDEAISDMKQYCPKVRRICINVTKLPGKHIVYSNFVKIGVDLLEAAFRSKGWVDFRDPAAASHPHKVFVVWDGSIKDSDKEKAKAIMNKKGNMDGKFIRLIIGSPSIKEGVSFKHIQHVHLLDPVWNFATKMQIEGRAIRFCSHVEIPVDHPTLRRSVVIHIYKMALSHTEGMIVRSTTVDQDIYDEMIPDKYKNVQIIENALKEVSFDHILYRSLHKIEESPAQWSHPSPIDIGADVEINDNKRKVVENKTCPKKRRPHLGSCPEPDMVIEKNKHDDDCCYKPAGKKKPAKAAKAAKVSSPKPDKKPARNGAGANMCPKKRRPVNGVCTEDNSHIKPNKQGDDCCYKNRG